MLQQWEHLHTCSYLSLLFNPSSGIEVFGAYFWGGAGAIGASVGVAPVADVVIVRFFLSGMGLFGLKIKISAVDIIMAPDVRKVGLLLAAFGVLLVALFLVRVSRTDFLIYAMFALLSVLFAVIPVLSVMSACYELGREVRGGGKSDLAGVARCVELDAPASTLGLPAKTPVVMVGNLSGAVAFVDPGRPDSEPVVLAQVPALRPLATVECERRFRSAR